MGLPKPYYETELGKLYHGDCLDIMPQLEPVDLVLTDIPYGVNFASWDGIKLKKHFKLWLNLFVNHSKITTFLCGWPNLAKFCQIKEPSCYLYWYKPGAMGFGPFGFTHIDPMPVWGKIKMNGTHDVILAPIIVKKKVHDCQKPDAWARGAIQKFKNIDLIIDPFMGSGTVGMACEYLNRRWIGIEIEEKYCEIAAKRIEKERRNIKNMIIKPWELQGKPKKKTRGLLD